MEDLLRDTISFYSVDPVGRRAAEQGSSFSGPICFYITEDGRRCAIGRYMTDEGINDFGDSKKGLYQLIPLVLEKNNMDSDNFDVIGNNMPKVPEFSEKVHDIPIGFLARIQDLHDGVSCWNLNIDGGLSEFGKSRVKIIIDTFDLDPNLIQDLC